MMNDVPQTVAQLLAWGERELSRAGVVCAHGTEDFRDEAAALIFHVLRLSHDDPQAYARPVDPAARRRCEAVISERIARRLPAPYVLGEAWFAGLPFFVDRSVLVPRSPFAELIESRFEPWLNAREVRRILEIGTGSGCIAVACALSFPQAEVVATDISPAALAVARRNVQRHGVADRVRLLQADLFAGIAGRYELIVSNPPYVPDDDLRDMPPEFAWEPYGALAGGPDGLDLVRRIIAGAAAHLEAAGMLAVEVGGGAAALEAAFPRVPFVWPTFRRGGDGIALVAAVDLPGDNAQSRRQGRRH